jgi:hypothetical protein
MVGANNSFGGLFFDGAGDAAKSDSYFGLTIVPNILGELAFTPHLLLFAAAQTTLHFQGGDDEDDPTFRNNDVSYTELMSVPGTQASVGLRYQRTQWAVEAAVNSNPFVFMNGNNPFARLGGFIYF